MYVLAVILARAGSKGLRDKCVRPLLGRPLIEYTFEHARASKLINNMVFTTDSKPAADIARRYGIRVIDRPAELADDTARVDAAARHALAIVEGDSSGRPPCRPIVPRPPRGADATRLRYEGESSGRPPCRPVDIVVLLYGNVPVRAPGIIDRAVEHLIDTGADSVRTVAPVTKQHPDWIHRLDGDRMFQYRENGIYRRQDLDPLYYHDGAVLAVTRGALFTPPGATGPGAPGPAGAHPEDFHAFLGRDRRAIVQAPEDTVDVDAPIDLHLAEAILKAQRIEQTVSEPS